MARVVYVEGLLDVRVDEVVVAGEDARVVELRGEGGFGEDAFDGAEVGEFFVRGEGAPAIG